MASDISRNGAKLNLGRPMRSLQFYTPKFRLRSVLLAAATAFIGVLCFVSAVKGCSGSSERGEVKAAAPPEWPEGFVELDPAGTALPAGSAQTKDQPSPR
jgi:hypothetical protein